MIDAMRYAILSDVHGRRTELEAVLSDARERGAEQIISLGDVGGDDCLRLLRQSGAMAVFGNYEVSGWRRLQAEHRAWVQRWPPLLAEDGFLAVHAAPWWPEGLQSVADFGQWLRRTGRSWRALFPYLTEDKDHLWQALAELEETGKTILFHGHTHVQEIWRSGPRGHARQVRATAVRVEMGYRYVVGVGSVGLPEDGGPTAYVWYDAEAQLIELIRIGSRRPNRPV
jgi:diadenosine tetraphosphatase ApaH/serine/threonine PP2A family protein phosphatase